MAKKKKRKLKLTKFGVVLFAFLLFVLCLVCLFF